MVTKQFILIFLLAIAAIITSWLALGTLQTGGTNAPQNPKLPDSIMKDIHSVRMDETTGQPHDELIAPYAIHYPDHNSTKITNPHFILYEDNNIQPWHLTAENGSTDNGITSVHLWDNVVFQQAQGPQNKASIINTSSLMIFPKQQYAQTDQPITAIQPGLIVHAVGMHVDFKTQTVDLFSQVTARYQSTSP